MNGYRIAPQFRERYREQQYIGKGASILKIYDAPSDSEETFIKWWEQEVKIAQRDGVIIIVMKEVPYLPQRVWLQKLEQEWFESDYAGGVRVSTYQIW